jgi:hypothetical protein
MKLRIMVLVLLGVAVLAAAAQTQKKGTVQDKATAQALLDLENKWVDALMKSDAAALDSIFADTYVDADEHGHRSDKDGLLSVVKSGELKSESIKLSDMRVQLYGDAAIVTGSAAQAGSFKGQPFSGSIIFTDTFIRQNGIWRAVASHRSGT